MIKAALLSTLTLVALLALVGCTTSAEPTPEAAKLTLEVGVNMDADGLWWRVICPDDALGHCWISADPQLTYLATA